MIFTTFWFFIFAAVFLTFFYAFPWPRVRSVMLAAASTVFYLHFAGPAGVAPILILAGVTYAAARSRRPSAMVAAIVLCAASLVFYKYTAFMFDSLAKLVPGISAFPVSRYMPAIAPLAISFFVFEFVHYLYDVKKGEKPIEAPLDFYHFAMFFPTLVAGPIKRYEQFVPSLQQGLASAAFLSPDFQAGLARMAAGFAKKLVADSLTLFVATYDGGFASHPLALRWLIFSALAMRIYLDFSGYSDMAIGFARMMGIRIPENFNWPYIATSVKEFWRRWHISLSSWIRDYLYVPLGGNRAGFGRHGANLLVVFFVCGLWHGAAWNYVLWGLYHGFGLVVNHIFGSLTHSAAAWPGIGALAARPRVARITQAAAIVPSWMLTTLFVWSGWLLFFYPPKQALGMFRSLFNA